MGLARGVPLRQRRPPWQGQQFWPRLLRPWHLRLLVGPLQVLPGLLRHQVPVPDHPLVSEYESAPDLTIFMFLWNEKRAMPLQKIAGMTTAPALHFCVKSAARHGHHTRRCTMPRTFNSQQLTVCMHTRVSPLLIQIKALQAKKKKK